MFFKKQYGTEGHNNKGAAREGKSVHNFSGETWTEDTTGEI
jgi:hypothetical protein